MKVERFKENLCWLMCPEDSSVLEEEWMRNYSFNQNAKESLLSVIKFLLWYAISVVMAFILAGLD
ncbi:MAG: hypothetical protein ABFS19_01120 [Thermodesulfobacteriota bacterium]